MKASKISIKNILGLEEVEIVPGSLTVISGPNKQGKTSAIEAIKSALKGGHDATLLRHGTDKGEVVIDLDDGTSIVETVTANRTEINFRDKDGRKMSSPASKIKALIDVLSINPLEFINARAQDRAKILLETMPLKLDVKLVEEKTKAKILNPELPAIDVLTQIYNRIFEDRAGTKRVLFEKNASINQMEIAVENYEDLPVEEIDENDCREKLEKLSLDKIERFKNIDDAVANQLKKNNDLIDGFAVELKKEVTLLEDQIKKLKESFETTVKSYKENHEQFSAKGQARKNEIAAEVESQSKGLKEQIDKIKETTARQAKRAQLFSFINEAKVSVQVMAEINEEQNAILDWIAQHKIDLLKSLPIPGLEVRDNQVYFENTPFDRLNEATKVDIAIDIAKLRAGELKLICVDGLERLDPETFEVFAKKAVDADMQLIVTRVEHDQAELEKGLQINTFGGNNA
jgi:DNA repair exonuclease SbcCD ATPase subunit